MDTIYIIAGLGILTWFIGLMRGSGLDKYLLAGYNTASKEERAKMDQPEFIRNFKQFHLILGSAIIMLGSGIYYFLGSDWGLTVATSVMLGGYIVFFANGRKFGQVGSSISSTWALWIMIAVLVMVACSLYLGMSSSNLTISPNGIAIDGIYGEEIAAADIQSVCVVDDFPKPISKSNGFSLSKMKKGWFVNTNGQNVKLIIEDVDSLILHIRTVNGEDVYYQNDDMNAAALQTNMAEQWPDIVCED